MLSTDTVQVGDVYTSFFALSALSPFVCNFVCNNDLHTAKHCRLQTASAFGSVSCFQAQSSVIPSAS